MTQISRCWINMRAGAGLLVCLASCVFVLSCGSGTQGQPPTLPSSATTSADTFKLDETGLSGIVPSGYSLVTRNTFKSGLVVFILVFHANETQSEAFRSYVVSMYPQGVRPPEISEDNLDGALSSMRQAFAKSSDKVVTAKVTTLASAPAIVLEVQQADRALHQEAALHLSSGRWITVAANQSPALVPVDVQQQAFAELIASLIQAR